MTTAQTDWFDTPAPPAPEDVMYVDVGGYEGPLDLLLDLARRQKVDLAAISVLALAEQYLAFIETVREKRIEVAADYLVMAAWLAYLKSRLMVPQAVVLGIAWAAEGLERLTGRATLLSRERVAQWTAPRWTISDARARREIGYDSTCDVTWGMKETATWYRQVGWI